MIEDILSREECVRLESVAQANAGGFGLSMPELLAKAKLIETYIRHGKIPEIETQAMLATVTKVPNKEN